MIIVMWCFLLGCNVLGSVNMLNPDRYWHVLGVCNFVFIFVCIGFIIKEIKYG